MIAGYQQINQLLGTHGLGWNPFKAVKRIAKVATTPHRAAFKWGTKAGKKVVKSARASTIPQKTLLKAVVAAAKGKGITPTKSFIATAFKAIKLVAKTKRPATVKVGGKSLTIKPRKVKSVKKIKLSKTLVSKISSALATRQSITLRAKDRATQRVMDVTFKQYPSGKIWAKLSQPYSPVSL